MSLVPAEDAIAAALREAGLPVTAPDAVVPVGSSRELGRQLGAVGANPLLGLSGHPPVRIETMATARLYRQGGELRAYLPAVLEEGTFYLADDPEQLADAVASELRLLRRHWRAATLPLLLVPVAAGPFRRDPEAFLRLGRALQAGELEGCRCSWSPCPMCSISSA